MYGYAVRYNKALHCFYISAKADAIWYKSLVPKGHIAPYGISNCFSDISKIPQGIYIALVYRSAINSNKRRCGI